MRETSGVSCAETTVDEVKYVMGAESPLILLKPRLPRACLTLLHRDVIFDGYTDALTIKLMNKDLASRNLTIRCSTQDVLEWNMYCQPLYNGDCTDVGFQVRTIAVRTREFSRAYLVRRTQGPMALRVTANA